MPLAICCRHVGHRYGGHEVLRDVCWNVPAGTCTALVGRSGAGKSTLLRLLAGLEPPHSGEILFDSAQRPRSAADRMGQPAMGTAGRRWPRVGMVFQTLGLWPHLTARQHVACMQRGPRGLARARVEELLREVRLPSALWDRRPAALSGGEAQRLALARALAGDPELLLLDEPLAQVDAPLRGELAELIRRIVERRELTCVYVTHHGQEALEMGSRLAVLAEGTLVQEGPAEAVYWKPVSAEAARLTGPVVELPKRLWPRAAPPGPDEGIIDGGQTWLVRPQRLDLAEAEACRAPHVPAENHLAPPPLQVAWCRPHGCGWQVALEGAVPLLLWSRQSWRAGAAVRLCLLPATMESGKLYDSLSWTPLVQRPAEPPG
jgi:ABC-type sulfate/molybdate transport systems ATPase subunit